MIRHSTPLTLQDCIHRMVLCGKRSIADLADTIGWSQSSLYRAANPCDDVNFPAAKLIPSMMAQEDYSPLQHMASRCGFVLYKIPKKQGMMKPKEIAGLQGDQAEAVGALIRFFIDDCEAAEVTRKIDKAIGGLARGRRAVAHGTKQLELDL